MSRYDFAEQFFDRLLPREEIIVTDPAIDDRLLLFNTYYHCANQNGTNQYMQDPCVNRYDLNKDILTNIVQNDAYSMLWILDPEFMTLDLAIELAKLGKGQYISQMFKNMWEIAVLRYMSGERKFYIPNSEFYSLDRLAHDADYASGDIEDYIYNFKNDNSGYIERDRRGYIIEEERRDAEVIKKKTLLKR